MEGNKGKKVITAVGIVISYLVMYAIFFCLRKGMTIEGYHQYKITVSYLLPPVIIALLTALIPYEWIGYIWRGDLVYKHIGISPSNIKIARIISAIVFYALIVLVGIWLDDRLFFGHRLYTHTFSMFLTWIVLYIIIYSFEILDNNVSLLIFDLFMIIANGVFVYNYTNQFFEAFFVTAALGILWCVLMLTSKRKNKNRAMIGFCAVNLSAFFAAIYFTGRWDKVIVWFEPENYDIGWEHLLLAGHSLQLPDYMSSYFAARHPFSAIFSYLGAVPLILFILAFIGMGILVIYSRKLLTRNRYMALLGLYLLFAIIFVYTFFADLGFVPTSTMDVVNLYMQIIFIGLMIRIFITRKVSVIS